MRNEIIHHGTDRVVGFGMDYREKYRELPYVSSVRKKELER